MKVREASQPPGSGVEVMKAKEDVEPSVSMDGDDAKAVEQSAKEDAPNGLTPAEVSALVQRELREALRNHGRIYDPQDHIEREQLEIAQRIPEREPISLSPEEVREMDLTPVEVTVAHDPLNVEERTPIWVNGVLWLVPRGVKTRVPFNVCLAIAETWLPNYRDLGRDERLKPGKHAGNLHHWVRRPSSRLPINLHNGTGPMIRRLQDAINTIPSPGDAPAVEAPMISD